MSLCFLRKRKVHRILNLYLFPNHLGFFKEQKEDLVIHEFRISLEIRSAFFRKILFIFHYFFLLLLCINLSIF